MLESEKPMREMMLNANIDDQKSEQENIPLESKNVTPKKLMKSFSSLASFSEKRWRDPTFSSMQKEKSKNKQFLQRGSGMKRYYGSVLFPSPGNSINVSKNSRFACWELENNMKDHKISSEMVNRTKSRLHKRDPLSSVENVQEDLLTPQPVKKISTSAFLSERRAITKREAIKKIAVTGNTSITTEKETQVTERLNQNESKAEACTHAEQSVTETNSKQKSGVWSFMIVILLVGLFGMYKLAYFYASRQASQVFDKVEFQENFAKKVQEEHFITEAEIQREIANSSQILESDCSLLPEPDLVYKNVAIEVEESSRFLHLTEIVSKGPVPEQINDEKVEVLIEEEPAVEHSSYINIDDPKVHFGDYIIVKNEDIVEQQPSDNVEPNIESLPDAVQDFQGNLDTKVYQHVDTIGDTDSPRPRATMLNLINVFLPTLTELVLGCGVIGLLTLVQAKMTKLKKVHHIPSSTEHTTATREVRILAADTARFLQVGMGLFDTTQVAPDSTRHVRRSHRILRKSTVPSNAEVNVARNLRFN